MDKRSISFLLRRPATWIACVQVLTAMLLKKGRATVSRQGIKIRTRIGNGEGLFCAVAGTDYEPEMRWFLSQMKQGHVFVDVGANVGIYSLHASRLLGAAEKIFAFEPTPQTHNILLENIRINQIQNIKCLPLALSNRIGHLSLIEGDRPASNSFADEGTNIRKEEALTQATTLNSFCEEHGVTRIDFLKADIEGGKQALFQGAKESLVRFKPTILFENMHTGPLFPERTILKDLCYKLYLLDGNGIRQLDDFEAFFGSLIAIFP